MYGEVLKVYGEDLNLANEAKVVKAQGNMGGLVVRLVPIADASTFKATTVTVKAGDDASSLSEIGEFSCELISSEVKAGQVIAEFMLPWDVARYVSAELDGSGETTNARVTLGYLPR